MPPAEPEIHRPPLEVLFVVGAGFFARLGPVVRHLAVAMIDSAVQLTVACAAEGVGDDFFGPLRLLRYASGRRLATGGRYSRLIREVAKRAPGVSFVFGAERRVGRGLTRAVGCPVVYVASSSAELRTALSAAEPTLPLVVLSTPLLEQALHRHRVAPQRVRLIRPGLHLPGAKPTEEGEGQDHAVASEDSAAAPPTVLVEAPLRDDCGVPVVFEAVKRIRNSGSGIMVFLLGAGPAEGRLRRQCERLGLRQQVIFAGTLAIGQLELAGFDVFIRPCTEDALSLQVIQALGAGVAVITPGAGNHDCLVGDKTALFYDASSPASLAVQIQRLLDDRPFARSLAAAGAQHVRRYHQVSTMAEAYVQLQQELRSSG